MRNKWIAAITRKDPPMIDTCSPGGGGGGALEYLGGRIRSLSKLKSTPKALISGQKSTLILIKTLTFSTK